MGIPILITTFRRPALLEMVLKSLPVNPGIVYIWINGPNGKNDQATIADSIRVIERSEIAKLVVKVNEEHFQSGDSIVRALDWVFASEKSAIILEDDVIPDSSFFFEAEYFLNEFHDDFTLGGIVATNFVPRNLLINYQPFKFRKSIFTSSWGWATWKSRWELFERDLRLVEIDEFVFPNLLNNFIGRSTWRRILKDISTGETDHWDYRWQYTNWKNGWFTAVPNANLALNLGFEAEATHTNLKPSWLKNEVESFDGFSDDFMQNSYHPLADKWILKHVHPIGRWYWLKTYIKRKLLFLIRFKSNSK